MSVLPVPADVFEPEPLDPELSGALELMAKAAGVDPELLAAAVRDLDVPVDVALGRLLLVLGRCPAPPARALGRPATSGIPGGSPARPYPRGHPVPRGRGGLSSWPSIAPAFRPTAAPVPSVEPSSSEIAPVGVPPRAEPSAEAPRAAAPPARYPVPVPAQVIGEPVPVRIVTDGADLPHRRRRVARAALWLRNIGIIIIVFLGYQLWGTRFEQHRAQAHLRADFQRATVARPAAGPTGGDSPVVAARNDTTHSAAGVAATAPAPLVGGVVARIEIPAIAVEQYVVEGTGEAQLKKGPGHYSGTPLPGQPGNAAIAGHRTTYGAPFNRLDALHPGDAIYATTAAGRFLYSVTGKLTVSPSQTSVVDDYGDNRLTLTTCTPEFSATHRLVVIAALIGPAPAAVVTHTAPPPPLSSVPRPVAATHRAPPPRLPTDRWKFDAWACVTAVLVGLALVGLSLAYRPLRRRVPPVAAAVVLAPFWLAGILLFFEQLTRFLPANV